MGSYPDDLTENTPDAPWNQNGFALSVLEDTRATLIAAKEALESLKYELSKGDFEDLTTVGWNQIGIITYLDEIIFNISKKIWKMEDGDGG